MVWLLGYSLLAPRLGATCFGGFSLLAGGATFLGRYLHGVLFSDQTNGMLKNHRWILDSRVLLAMQKGGSKL